MAPDIHLVTQYFRVVHGSSIEERQREIDEVLRRNIENPHISTIHLMLEEGVEVPQQSPKLRRVFIGKRLTYKTAFDYYNKHLNNQICVLSNADIYFDDTLKYLHNINWGLGIVVCPTRYEHDYQRGYPIRYGEEQDLSKESRWLEPWAESVFTQDCWIWRAESIHVKDCDFGLGITGCDNLIARRLHDSGYTLANCSSYITVNHYDHLSRAVHGIGKGGESSKRETRLAGYRDYCFIGNGRFFPDKYCERIVNTRRGLDFWGSRILDLSPSTQIQPLRPLLRDCQIQVSSCLVGRGGHQAALHGSSYWEADVFDEKPTLTVRFHHAVRMACLDIQGVGEAYPKQLEIWSSRNGHTFHKVGDYEALTVDNANHVKRIYLDDTKTITALRLYVTSWEVRPVLRFESYFVTDSFIDSIVKTTKTFQDFVVACQTNEKHRAFLTTDALYTGKLVEAYKSHPAVWRTRLDPEFFVEDWERYRENLSPMKRRTKNCLGVPIKKGVSILICVMNRVSNVMQFMSSWLLPEVNQVVIVDWSSTREFSDVIKDPRILYARVEGETRFIRTFAQNLAADLAEYDTVLKLDSDITLSRDFFAKNTLEPGTFLCGSYMVGRDINERYTHGNVFVHLDDYWHVHGYNEIIQTYGHDDSDFSLRLQLLAGLRQGLLDLDTMYHHPHGEDIRLKNLGDGITDSRLETEVHRYCLDRMPLWNRAFDRQVFDFKKIGPHHLRCVRDPTRSMYSFPSDLMNSAREHVATYLPGNKKTV